MTMLNTKGVVYKPRTDVLSDNNTEEHEAEKIGKARSTESLNSPKDFMDRDAVKRDKECSKVPLKKDIKQEPEDDDDDAMFVTPNEKKGMDGSNAAAVKTGATPDQPLLIVDGTETPQSSFSLPLSAYDYVPSRKKVKVGNEADLSDDADSFPSLSTMMVRAKASGKKEDTAGAKRKRGETSVKPAKRNVKKGSASSFYESVFDLIKLSLVHAQYHLCVSHRSVLNARRPGRFNCLDTGASRCGIDFRFDYIKEDEERY